MPTAIAQTSIVVGVDATTASDFLLSAALRAAETRPRSIVHAVYALGLTPAASAKDIRKLDVDLDRGAAFLRGYLDRSQRKMGFGNSVVAHVRPMLPAEAMVALAKDVGARLIIVGRTPRKGLSKLLHTTTSSQILEHAPCDVLVVGARNPGAASKRVEPVCLNCVKVRAMTNGADWWCNRHHESPRPPMHVFHYRRRLALRTPTPVGGH